MKKIKGNKLLSFCLLLSLALPVSSQTTPFLTDEEIRMLRNEISGDRAY